MDVPQGIPDIPRITRGLSCYLVGIKGTGMTALADVLCSRGALVSGSDTEEVFYTDRILQDLGVPIHQGFDPANLPDRIDLLVYSVAYDPYSHPELIEARRRGIRLHTYPEVLGALSKETPCIGISGVHGKSTTTAMIGTLVAAQRWPATVVVGTAVPSFGGRSALTMGDNYLILEACEYRRSFMNYHVDCAVITSVELDHPDYYKTPDAVRDAFVEWVEQLNPGATLLYCADDPGAVSVAERAVRNRSDLDVRQYGWAADGPLAITDLRRGAGENHFRVAGFDLDLSIRVPGDHNVLNAVAALGTVSYLKDTHGLLPDQESLRAALRDFQGTRRRTEVVGERDGVLVVDDYGHHPTAIRKTLQGLRDFYPGRRLVVDFMSHTFSRTGALLADFGQAFDAADHVILHRIYASAREQNPLGVSGRDLYDLVSSVHHNVHYFHEPLQALPHLQDLLRPGDVLVTMGAGDNWKLGQKYIDGREQQ